jgi:hypothetical protein
MLMSKPDEQPTDAQRKAAAFLTRPRPDTTAWRMAHAEIGDVMPDGTIYAGFSTEKNAYMFVPTEGSPALISFNQAAQYVRECKAHGRADWQLPSAEELQAIFPHKEEGSLKGTFNAARYWSSTEYGRKDWVFMRFVDVKYPGTLSSAYRDNDNNINGCRPVRYLAAGAKP